ncbi:hypothetical protein ACJX0J_021699, partial [Zea mays]
MFILLITNRLILSLYAKLNFVQHLIDVCYIEVALEEDIQIYIGPSKSNSDCEDIDRR